jgi:hypothetical protein
MPATSAERMIHADFKFKSPKGREPSLPSKNG